MPSATKPREAPATVQYVRPREATTGDYKGEPFNLSPREIFATTHRYVRAYPHLFRPVEQTRDRPAVESMTAGPGEKRGA